MNKHLTSTTIKDLSTLKVKTLISDDYGQHVEKFKPCLDAIKSISKDDFDVDLNKTLICGDDARGRLPDVSHVTDSLVPGSAADPEIVRLFSQKVQDYWGMLSCKVPVQIGTTEFQTQMDAAIKLKVAYTDDEFAAEFYQLFQASDIPHLISLYSYNSINSAITTFASSGCLLQIMGPAAFIASLSYVYLDLGSSLKDTIYALQLISDQAKFKRYRNYTFSTTIVGTLAFGSLSFFMVPGILPEILGIAGSNISAIIDYQSLSQTMYGNIRRCLPNLMENPIYHRLSRDVSFKSTDAVLNFRHYLFNRY